MAPPAMNDVFDAMEEPSERSLSPEELDLTPKSPCANIFDCCLPKREETNDEDEAQDTSEKRALVVDETKSPDLMVDTTTNSNKTHQQNNVVVAFWQLLLSIVFFTWLEERSKTPRISHDTPPATKPVETEN